MMLCGALRSDGSGYRESRTKTEFASVITPRWSVVEKNISVGATSWLAPVGSGRSSRPLTSSLTVDAPTPARPCTTPLPTRFLDRRNHGHLYRIRGLGIRQPLNPLT